MFPFPPPPPFLLPPPPFFPPPPPLPFMPPNPFAMFPQPPNPIAAANQGSDLFGGNGLIFLMVILVLTGALGAGTALASLTTLLASPIILILLLVCMLGMGGGGFLSGWGSSMTPILFLLGAVLLGIVNLNPLAPPAAPNA